MSGVYPLCCLAEMLVLALAICFGQIWVHSIQHSRDPEANISRETPGFTIELLESYHVIADNDSNRWLAQNTTDFICGKKRFCNESLSNRGGLCSFECGSCRCDEMCHIYGDCCPDLLFQHSETLPSLPSQSVSCFKADWTTFNDYESVFMVTRCLSNGNEENESTKKCHDPDIADPLQATPVSNFDQNITYRNVYCALCHGVTDVVSWGHDVTCTNSMVLADAKTKTELWRIVVTHDNDCSIDTTPPEGFLMRFCKHAPMDRCNITGRWKSPEPKIEELCHLYNHTVDYYGSESKYRYNMSYRNIFCAMCNGVEVTKDAMCLRVKSPYIPHAMAVLLAFNPEPHLAKKTAAPRSRTITCNNGEKLDPFFMTCREILCPYRRLLWDGGCKTAFSAVTGLGFQFNEILTPSNGLTGPLPYLAQEYKAMLIEVLRDFYPLEVNRLLINKLGYVNFFSGKIQLTEILIHAEFVTLSNKSLPAIEEVLWEFMSNDKTFFKNNITFSSSPNHCPLEDRLLKSAGLMDIGVETDEHPLDDLHTDCKFLNCLINMASENMGLVCPYFQYNLSKESFVLDDKTNVLSVDDVSMSLNSSRVVLCGEILKVCLDALPTIPRGVAPVSDDGSNFLPLPTAEEDLTMSIVSLVCISLSLFCLLLTFLVYIFVKKPTSVPGLNTVALIFHLFCAQLLFLVGSNRTENIIICKIFGIAIHFSWLATFCWMVVSAYHMFSVFTKMRPVPVTGGPDFLRFFRYFLFCILSPVGVVGICIVYYLTRSNGSDFGYGGKVCFLREPLSIAVFFASPLAIVLIINAVFFTRTIISIKSVPNMEEVSNKSNKGHVFIYIKLSLLFGFTWVFGIVAAIVRSDILWYTFIVLTGSQGVFLFLAYCVNRRTLNMIKVKFTGNAMFSSRNSDGSK